MRRSIAFLLCCGLAACAASRTDPAAVPAPAREATAVAADGGEDLDEIPLDEGSLDPAGAAALVAEMEAALPVAADHALRQPKSLDDVIAILKLDQVNLFPYGVARADREQGVAAAALGAQIELAWGEAYVVLLEVLLALDERFDAAALELEERPSLTAEQRVELDWLNQTLARTARLAEAFQMISMDHLANGAGRAAVLIAEHPDSYLGYRVAADYYRTVRDWESFARMVAKIEELNPKSNGLVFLRGTAAFGRDEDRETAMRFYRQALANDPEFVRAQAHLVMVQVEVAAIRAEVAKLAVLNPSHQLVHWAGEVVERAYQRYGGE